MTKANGQFDVAIIGYGPVGATAALLLASRGLSVAVVERLTDLFPLPRAAIYDGEIARVFQNLGVQQRMREHVTPLKGGGFRTADFQVIGEDLLYPEGWVGSQGHHDAFSFHQPHLEHTLRERAAELGVKVWLGHEAAHPVQTPGGVVVTAQPVAGGAPVTIAARWLIAADGAASPVREQLGIDWGSLGYDRDWLVMDLILPEGAGKNLPQIGLQVCDPDRIHTYVPMAGSRRRWEFIFNPGETREELLESARQWELLAAYLKPGEAEIERAAAYQFHSAIAERWQEGNIFLAGDAAHQTAPFLGQGMCTGIRDAANLAWKLDFVKRGLLPESALASYGAERRPHARDTVDHAVALGNLMDAFAQAQRDGKWPEDISAIYGGERRREHLSGGILAAPRGYDGDRLVGTLAPQPLLRDGGNAVLMDDTIGTGFRLVTSQRWSGPERDRLEPQFARLGGTILELPPANRASAQFDALLQDHAAVLIRPDHYIFGVSQDDAGTANLLRELLSHFLV